MKNYNLRINTKDKILTVLSCDYNMNDLYNTIKDISLPPMERVIDENGKIMFTIINEWIIITYYGRVFTNNELII